MKLLTILLTLLVTTVTFCFAQQPLATGYIKGVDYEGVIFPASEPVWLEQQGYGRYQPKADEIELAEELLGVYLNKQAKVPDAQIPKHFLRQLNEIVPRLSQYRRQYFGLVTKEGRKVLWVNFFLYSPGHDSFPEWKTKQVVVSDGGSAFFALKVDLASGTVFDLSIHGDA